VPRGKRIEADFFDSLACPRGTGDGKHPQSNQECTALHLLSPCCPLQLGEHSTAVLRSNGMDAAKTKSREMPEIDGPFP